MIIIELFSGKDETPSIYEVSQPHLIRLAVVEAYRAGNPIPATVPDAAAYLCDHSPRFWAFHSIEAASDWVRRYNGPSHALIKFIVQNYLVSEYTDGIKNYKATLKEVV
jgi:hypothetical protein